MIKHASYLPNIRIENDYFKDIYDDWNSQRFYEQTGVKTRYYASEEETTATMGAKALLNLIEKYNIDKNEIDFIVCVTETPDNVLPAAAYKIHKLVELPKSCGAYDINHGCAGFTYGLMTACNLVKTNSAKNVILINADKLSPYLDDEDRGIKVLVGDGASACLINEEVANKVMNFVFGSDSDGYDKIIIKEKESSNYPKSYLYMDGMDVFYFAINSVPNIIQEILEKNNMELNNIDMVILHQANKTILKYIQKRLKLSDDKFYVNMEDTGNTASVTIPLAIENLNNNNKLQEGMNILLLGFGVGYSWCGTIIKW